MLRIAAEQQIDHGQLRTRTQLWQFLAGAVSRWTRGDDLLHQCSPNQSRQVICKTLWNSRRRIPPSQGAPGQVAANVGPATIRLIVSRFLTTEVHLGRTRSQNTPQSRSNALCA